MIREAYFAGCSEAFEKLALQDSQATELGLAALTSALPFGTTAHTMGGQGRERAKEWILRQLLGKGISIPAAVVGARFGGKAGALAGLLGGGAIGEVAASQLAHGHKYHKGKLLPKYKKEN